MNQHTPGQKRIAVMVILRHGKSFMLLCRNKEPNRDKFVPVGGKLEPYETPRQAALRETFEETGLQLDTVKFCGVLTETSPTNYNWLCYIYIADIERVPPPSCDEGTLQWIDLQDILSVPTPPTDWYIYKYALANKPFVFNAVFNEHLEMTFMEEEIEGLTVHGSETSLPGF